MAGRPLAIFSRKGGSMQPDTFDARWISGEPLVYEPEQTYYDECHRNHVVRASFEIAHMPEHAVLAIAVMGYARVLINGARVDGSELLGWWTNYTKRVYSYETEVAGALVKGLNTIEIELGNGFFNPSPLRLFGKYNLRERLAEVGTPRVMAALIAGDGSLLVKTDGSWMAREGDLLFNNVYLGEVRDLRDHEAHESSVRVWDEVRHIKPSPVSLCVRGETISHAHVFEHEGKVVIDFGAVVAGFYRMRLRAHEGQRVEIVYAETWRDGAPYAGTAVAGYAGMETPRGVCPGGPGAPEPAVQRDVIVCHEGEDEFENEFCWHSFRYAALDGVDLRDIIEAQAVFIHTDLEPAGHLELDDGRFARLHEAAVRTKLNNNHGLFEDCARERFGYGGDMIALAASQTFSFDVSGLIDRTLADFARDQTERGGLPETAPFMGIGSNGPAYGEGPLLWQLAYPYLSIEADRIYGRRNLLEREWVGIERFGDYLLGFEPEELAPHCLGDHGSLIAQGFSNGSPDKEFVGWCAILWGLELVREAAERLSRDPSRFATAARALRGQIVSRFKQDDGSFGDGTQTSWAFAAWLGLEDQSKLVRRLAREIESAGVLTTGIFGTMFAFELLARYGYNEVLERWLLREEDPSLLGMLASGDGALIEMFDDPLASCDHAMFSSYDQWFYQGLGGLLVDRDAYGCDRIVIKPYLSHVVNRFSCSWRVPAGEISVSWTREAEGVTLTVRVPDGIEAVLADPWGCESTERKVDGCQISMRIKEER